ncbi:unnamed protein product [Staurois parvus]|uniref:Uncharacterized protein n=1 Tax=Staurois parvus TaxID=386267 RepID=A0ABN9EMN6_9NEOB|nr:unnamed protein product [Staurois parvus]
MRLLGPKLLPLGVEIVPASVRLNNASLLSGGGIAPFHCVSGRNSAKLLVSVGGIVPSCVSGRNSAASLVSV